MLELVFVIIVMGILAKFGVELFKQTYEGYTRSLYINELQTKSANAVQTIVNRLTYRIKDSIRNVDANATADTIGSSFVKWKGMDIDGWRNNSWGGIVDLAQGASTATQLSTPGTGSGGEIFFIGSNIGSTLLKYHDTNSSGGPGTLSGNFSGTDVYEYFQMTDGDHDLTYSGSTLTLDGNLLVDDVTEFLIEKLGDGVHIHLCLGKTGNPLVEGQVCKDKFVF